MTERTQVWEICNGCDFHKGGTKIDTQRHTVTVPRVFFSDHMDRCLVSEHSMVQLDQKVCSDGTPWLVVDVIKSTKNTLTVRLTMDDILELRSDAKFYSTEWKYMGSDFFGLGMSARATVKRIDKWMGEQQ